MTRQQPEPQAAIASADKSGASRRAQRSKGRPGPDDPKVGADTLVLKTCELLRKNPAHKITIAAVARHAGVNRALIRYYFGDRAGLMTAVARHLMAEREDLVEAPETPESAERAIRRTLSSLIHLHRRYPSFRDLVFDEIRNAKSPAGQQVFSEALDREITRTNSILVQLRGGEPTGSADAKLQSALLHLALIGMGESYVSSFGLIEAAVGAPLEPGDVDEKFVDFIAGMILHGMRKGG